MPTPDPASSIVVLRPAGTGFEVLMVRRNARGFFGGIVVFPGGRVDDVDVTAGGGQTDDLAHRYAAIRELAEETGILATADETSAAPDLRDGDFYRWAALRGVELGIERLVLISRWVTPEISPRRFDTRFYLLACEQTPTIRIDSGELVGHEWVTPRDALSRADSGDWPMILPTLTHLRWLERRSTIEEAMKSALGADGRTLIAPRRLEDGSLLPVHMPAEAS